MKLTLPGFNSDSFEKYLKNTSWLMLARVGTLFIKMFVNMLLLSNYLGTSLFGAYNYPLMFLAFFSGICTLGTDGIVTRALLQTPEKRDEILGSAFRLRLIGGLLALPFIYLSYFLIAGISIWPPAASFNQVAFVSSICIIQSVQIIDSYFQSQAQGKYIMFVQAGGNVASALIKVALVLCSAPISYFIGSLVLDSVFLQLGYIMLYRKQGLKIFHWKYNPEIARDLLRTGWPLALSAIFVSLYMKIDQLMIDSILGKDQLGIYSTVVTFSESWYFIPVAVSAALFPAIMNFRKNDQIRYYKRLNNFYELLVVLSLLVAIFVTLIAPWVYQLFYSVKNPAFLPGSRVLQVHIWAGLFAFIATGSSQYLIAEGYTRIALLRTALGAITNIILNLIWIPKFGIIGAAYSTILAYMTAAFSILLFPKTRKHGFSLIRSLFLYQTITTFFNKSQK